MKLKVGLLYISAYESGFTQPPAVWYEEMLQQIELGDASGFHGAWVAEHRIPGYAIASPPVFLMAAAARTRRIRLGTAVCLVSLHHPVQTAEDYAALDVLSGGRLDFGVGRGQFPYDYGVTGVDLAEGKARFAENLDAVVRLWREEQVVHEGQFHRFTHRLLPRPVQQPHPPVYMAAVRTPDSYVAAAERGFHLQVAPIFFTDLALQREYIGRYLDTAAAHGHDPARLDRVAVYPLYVGEREDDAREAADPYLRRYNSYGLTAATMGSTDTSLRDRLKVGVGSERAGGVGDGPPKAASGRTPMDFQSWKDGRVLFGTPDQVVDQIGRMTEAHGVNYPILEVFYGGQSHRETMAYLERFAARVMPQLDLEPPPAPVSAPATESLAPH